MTIVAEDLLAGPRGRRLCLEYALARADLAVTPEGRRASSVVFWAVHALEDAATITFLRSDASAAEAVEPPPHSPADAADALASIDVGAPTSAMLRDALAISVDHARGWQEPDGADVLAATPEVRRSLRRAAEVIAAAPDSAWWHTPVDLGDQWAVPWDGGGRPSADSGAELDAWRVSVLEDDARAAVERPSDPTARWTGWWWSIPPHGLVRTSRSLGDDGPAGLWFVEDFLGGDEATAVPVDAYPGRVIEIRTPEDWADLCRRHPLDVTASRRHDWYRVTGRDGRWVMPDWSAVAREADAVHLTVAGYLAVATRLIEIDDDRASVVAGWNPDETFWFRGTSARPAEQREWRREDGIWRRVTD